MGITNTNPSTVRNNAPMECQARWPIDLLVDVWGMWLVLSQSEAAVGGRQEPSGDET